MSHLEIAGSLEPLLKKTRHKYSSPDRIHGVLTAAVCGPQTAGPGRWLPFVFPGARDLLALIGKPSVEPVVLALIDMYNDLLFSVRAVAFVPYFPVAEGELPTFAAVQGWCEGFLQGMSLHGDEWLKSDNEHVASMTAPIFFISDPDGFGAEMGKEESLKLRSREQELIESIRYNVPAIYDHWNFGRKPEEKKIVL